MERKQSKKVYYRKCNISVMWENNAIECEIKLSRN